MKRVLSLLAGFLMVLAIYSGGVFSVSAQSNLFAGGSGDGLSPETAFLIATAAHLDNVRSYLGDEHADKYFKLIEDIDLNAAPYNQGKGWNPIGHPGGDNDSVNGYKSFCGNFDGNGKTISGLYINRTDTDNVGLFGVTGSSVIQNVYLMDVCITGGIAVGSLIGMNNSGTIVNVYAQGTVSDH